MDSTSQNTDCDACTTLIHFDPNSSTGASATLPFIIWEEPECPKGFIMNVNNLGSCKLYVFVKTISEPGWQTVGQPVALLDNDGVQKLTANGTPAFGFPLQPVAIIDEGLDQIQKLNEIHTAIGVLCVRTSPFICPNCDVEIELCLSDGAKLFYQIPRIPPPNSTGSTTIRGTVTCQDDGDTINVNNLRAQLIQCPCSDSDPSQIIAETSLTASPNITGQATYEFKNALVSCYRVQIVCRAAVAVVGSSSSSTSSSSSCLTSSLTSSAGLRRSHGHNKGVNRGNGTNNGRGNGVNLTGNTNNILASTDCHLVRGQTLIIAPDLDINCNACQDQTITVTGQAVCQSSSVGNLSGVTVQFIRCEQLQQEIKCGSQTGCGAALMVDPTFSAALDSTGVFTASITVGCYLVRFVCTSNPTQVLTVTPQQVCRYFCLTNTNLGTLTLNCACPLQQVNITGSVNCASGDLTGELTAQLLSCNSSCTSLTSPVNIIASTQVVNSTGQYTFTGVNAGCYGIRLVCNSCSSELPVTVGQIGCTNYSPTSTSTSTVTLQVSPITINCQTCNSVAISGQITCLASLTSNVRIQLTQFPNGCDVQEGKIISFITPSSTGSYSTCVQAGVSASLSVVCANNNSVILAGPTTCQEITEATTMNFTIQDCSCALSSTFTLTGVITNSNTGQGLTGLRVQIIQYNQGCQLATGVVYTPSINNLTGTFSQVLPLAQPQCYAIEITCQNAPNFILDGSLDCQCFNATTPGQTINIGTRQVSTACPSSITLSGQISCSLGSLDDVQVQLIQVEDPDGDSSNCQPTGLSTIATLNTTTGIFSSQVPPGCYQVKVVCQSEPGNILNEPLTCACYGASTNLGIISVDCTCGVITVSGTVTCASTGSTDDIAVIFVPCNPLRTALTPFTVSGGEWSGIVPADSYEVRYVCASNITTVLDTIPCQEYDVTTTLTITDLACDLC